MTTLIVTSADEKYVPLALDLIASVEPHRQSLDIEMACVDLGMSESSARKIGGQVRHLVKPDWPFKPHERFDADRRYLARAIRPFLPDLAPGYSCYIWLDADIWVQQAAGLAWLIDAAKGVDFAGVPTMHRSYQFGPRDIAWLTERYRMAFGEKIAAELSQLPYYNSGVMAVRAGSPLWRQFASRFQTALERWDGTFLSDQAVLNGTLYLDRMPVNRLPAKLNWLCHLALPAWNDKARLLVEPSLPFEPLFIVHNTFDDKQLNVPLTNLKGQPRPARLTHSGYKDLVYSESQ